MSSPPPPPRSRRGSHSFGDVVRGVVVLAVAVLVAVWLGSLFRNEAVVEPDAVDYTAVAEQAQPGAGFTLAVPDALPAGWRATSARWSPADQHWHVGIVTADDEYVGIEQAGGGASTVVAAYTAEATEAGTVAVAGERWRRLVDEQSGEVALVRETPRVATLVTGTAPEATLVTVAEGLGGGQR